MRALRSTNAQTFVKIFLPLAFTVGIIILFIAMRDLAYGSRALVAYLLFCSVYIMYIASGLGISFIVFPILASIVYIEFTTPLATPFFQFFRIFLVGHASTHSAQFNIVLSAFIGSGLMEELMKSLPAFIGLLLAMQTWPSNAARGSFFRSFRCSTPMEGMMIGFSAGALFVYIDICYHVIPTSGVYAINDLTDGLDGFGSVFQQVTIGLVGHVLWTSCSGFFLGLSARHPRFLLVLLATAWLLPAAFHTFWNLAPLLHGGRWIKIAIPSLTFLACFLTAKQIGEPGKPHYASADADLS
jgi:RsiW-degrading membrane proteinase PrsW (M82 family)